MLRMVNLEPPSQLFLFLLFTIWVNSAETIRATLTLTNTLPLPGKEMLQGLLKVALQKCVWSQGICCPLWMRKSPKTNSDSETAAICPITLQPTIGKSKGSRIERGSGMTSPYLSFPTQRSKWRSHHSFCWPHTASWPQVGPACPQPPPQSGCSRI